MGVQPGHVLIHLLEEALQVVVVRWALGVLPFVQRAAARFALQAQPAEHFAEDALGVRRALRLRGRRHFVGLLPHHRHGNVTSREKQR